MRRPRINPGRGTSLRLDLAALQRFLAKVTVDEHGCWLWTGHRDENGYGQFKWRGKALWVHRVSYATFRGRIRNGNEIDHKNCPQRAKACVHPEHLSQTTHEQNSSEGARYRANEEMAA